MIVIGLLIVLFGITGILSGRSEDADFRGLVILSGGVVLVILGVLFRLRSATPFKLLTSRKDRLSREAETEIAFHVEQLTKENIDAGMSPMEARRQALIAFGGVTQIAEECRRVRSVEWIDDFVHDLRFGCRTLVANPGYTIAAIFALSIGIGPNTAFFTLFDAVFLRPMPFSLSSDVVVLEKTTPGRRFPDYSFSYSEYEYYRDHNTTLEALSANIPFFSTAPGSAQAVSGLLVSSSYFPVMHVEPVVGHRFTAADDVPAAPPYPAMLSENSWERLFGRDPQILGRNLVFGDTPVEISGITPRDFMGSRPGVPDLWLPLAARAERECCRLEGRLKPGMNRQQAQAELTQLADAFHSALPGAGREWTIGLSAPTPGILRNSTLYREPGRNLALFTIFQAVTGMVLLIACANVSGLLLGKAVSRQKEIAIRLSLGASRGRLIRQLLTEALLIALTAGVIGLLMSWWILKVLIQMALSMLAGLIGGSALLDLTPDFRILLYTIAASTVTAIGFSLLPTLQATKLNLTESLKDESPGFGGKRKHDFRGPVSAQVAVCLMLLIGAGAIIGSSRPSLKLDVGFDVDRVLAISGSDPARRSELLDRLSAFSDIGSVASASGIPLSGQRTLSTAVLPKANASADEQSRAPRQPLMFVSQNYFETLGIAVLQGRTFTPQEISTRAPVAVISNTLAAELWPGENPVGRTITVGSFPSVDVIGVVRDVSASGLAASNPESLYLPSQNGGLESEVLIRTSKDPNVLVANLSRELRSIGGNSVSVQTMNSVLDSNPTLLVLRTLGTVLSVMGLMGLLLAAVGIYSMVGFAISHQTRDIGIRMALGARRKNILRMFLTRSMRPIVEGLAAGMVLGIILSLLMSRLFEAVKFIDLGLLAEISGLFVAIALLAAYVPARKATKLDPSVALRRN
jgi:predicted permease